MGAEQEFERLVDDHQAALFRFAMSLSRNEDDAGELVQETFFIWATKGHQLSDVRKAKTWLFTTLHREFLGRRRREIRFPHREIEEADPELPVIDPKVTESLDWTAVLNALDRVDEVYQAPVALFYLEDNSYNEIAEILEVPLGTVKSRIARGIAQLQRILNQTPRSRLPGMPGYR